MSLTSYPAYVETGVEWLGRAPANWELRKLGHLLRAAPCYGVLVPDFDDGGVPMLRITDMENGNAIRASLTTISHSLSEQYSRTIVEEGDIVLSVVGTIGVAFCVDAELSGVNLSRAVARVQVGPEIDASFLCWIFQSLPFRRYVDLICVGTAQRVLNMGDLCAYRCALPGVPEQPRIVDFLDRETAKIDALVAEQQRLIELLKEKRQAVISHAVTKGLNPDAPMKPSGIEWLGDVPAHWAIQRLSTVCDFVPGKAHEPFIDDEGEFICVNSRFVSTEGAATKFCSVNLTPARKNDVLMVMSDLPNGRALAKAYFVADEAPYAVNQRVCIIRARLAVPKYLFYWLNRSPGFLQHDDGANQTHLSNDTFTKLPTLLPPAEEQSAIAAFLDANVSKFEALTNEAQKAIELLKERRTALISAAVTGQIDVRELAKKKEAA